MAGDNEMQHDGIINFVDTGSDATDVGNNGWNDPMWDFSLGWFVLWLLEVPETWEVIVTLAALEH